MFRVRAVSFCTGFAVAAAASMYLLQKDLWASHKSLANQAEGYHAELEGRIGRLESITAGLAKPAAKLSASTEESAKQPQSS